MKNDKIVNAFNAIQPGDEVRNRVFDKAMQRQEKKRPGFITAASLAAAAAVICLTVFGGPLLSPQDANTFAIKAYAMEAQDDGTVEMREINLMEETQYWHSYNDGSVFYASVNLKCEGDNLEYVEFYTDNGFFAKQYLKIENGKVVTEKGVPASYRKEPGDENFTLLMYGLDFDVIGNSFKLEKNAMTDDFLLFLGTEVTNWKEQPTQMTVRAVATFSDGETQEETLTLDLSGEGGGTVMLSPEELERQQTESKKYQEVLHSIPLDRCEVVEGTMRTLTYGDTYEYQYQLGENAEYGASGTAYFPITKESMDAAGSEGLFDEKGIFRISSKLYDSWDEYDGSDGYIAVIERNGDDTFTGMVYRVPGQMILENMK
jgi:hypothetical protein